MEPSGTRPAVAVPSADGTSEMPPSDAEAKAFAKSLETTFTSSDPTVMNAAFDYNALVHRAFQGIDIDEQSRRI